MSARLADAEAQPRAERHDRRPLQTPSNYEGDCQLPPTMSGSSRPSFITPDTSISGPPIVKSWWTIEVDMPARARPRSGARSPYNSRDAVPQRHV